MIPPHLSPVLAKISLLTFFWLWCIPSLQAAEPTYYRTKALAGDGIYSMMRRYQLEDYGCNFDRFYALNKLTKNASLLAGREYLLPILVYEFNGQTIRASVGIDSWDLAVSIQKYNEQMLEAGQKEASYKVDLKLWVPHHILHCPQDRTPVPSPVAADPERSTASSSGPRMFPIFGSDYAHVPLIDNSLRGKIYYISAGHGGPDPGAIGHRGNRRLCEDEYAYDVSLRLCRNLIAHGATAYMIIRDPNDGIRDGQFLSCDSDEKQWGDQRIDRSQKVRLTERSDIINSLYNKHRLQGVTDQVAVMIHVDSRSTSERTDLFFYYQEDNPVSQRIARRMHSTIEAKYQQYQANRGYSGSIESRNLHMLRECTPASVYIELANIRNVYDQERIIQQRNRQLLADWLYEGLVND